MSAPDVWKALHLLYVCQRGEEGLSWRDLEEAGIRCYSDFMAEVRKGHVVQSSVDKRFTISDETRSLLSSFLLCRRDYSSDDLWVDYPQAFVAMPYSESWSAVVFDQMIKPAITGAGLDPDIAREQAYVGDLRRNVWGSLLRAGLVIADISIANANVYYELGLAHGLGKPSFLVKRRDTVLPADFHGFVYREYDFDDLQTGRAELEADLIRHRERVGMLGVKRLMGGPRRV